MSKPDAWFQSDAGRTVVANVLSYQTAAGDWPKNTDCVSAPFTGEPAKLHGTFDNSATTEELRFLARAINATQDALCAAAFLRGLDHILAAQYPNGGWPQRFPPGAGYDRYITFNDDTMVRLMNLLRDVATDQRYQFVDAERRGRAAAGFDRGIECIVRCQVRVGDRLTVWCAQHDEVDLRPRPARTFELASLSGSESVRITRLLMSLDKPSPAAVQAIDAAIRWFDQAKLRGIRQEYADDPHAPGGRNKIVVEDKSAPPLWARFYDLTTERPIFVDRDGVPRDRLSDIGYERRNGYGWLGTWPEDLLETEYPAWCRRHGHTPVAVTGD
jgi:PelA/Pel-15E family pectate lyase